MATVEADQGLAPKVFFVAPDPALISETFLETAFFQGYETYVLPDALGGDLKRKVEVLVEAFDDLLLFFTIDRRGSVEQWVQYLTELTQRFPDRLRTGVIYSRPESESLDHKIKNYFLFDVGITGGCVSLQASSRKNQSLLLDVLAANQAAGRRKRIRLICPHSFRVNFLHDEVLLDAGLLDLSVSHFSARFLTKDPDWDIGTKVRKVQLRLGGNLLMVNGLVALKRIVGGQSVYVVLFHAAEEGHSGLDELMKAKVNRIIYQAFQAETDDRLREALRRRA